MSLSYEYYNTGQDYTDMMAYSDYLGSLAGVPDYQGGASIWSMMYLMAMMITFDSDTVGQDAWIDNDINEIKGLTEDLNHDINAGNSTTYVTATDAQGHTSNVYYTEIDGKYYFCNKSDVGKTVNIDGTTYNISQGDTLDSKIRGDIDKIEGRVYDDPYFQDNPDLADQMVGDLEDLWKQVDDPGFGNGNLHTMYYNMDPSNFPDDPQTDANGDQILGNTNEMQPITDDLSSVQSQCTSADSVMQEIIKSVTSLVETEQDTMNNMYKALDKMEQSMNQHMAQGT